jgi:hypothetical protein
MILCAAVRGVGNKLLVREGEIHVVGLSMM